MKFSEKLKQLRISRGLSRKQLGELTEIPYRTIESYEQGRMEPSLDNLLKLAPRLDVSPCELIETLKIWRKLNEIMENEKDGSNI